MSDAGRFAAMLVLFLAGACASIPSQRSATGSAPHSIVGAKKGVCDPLAWTRTAGLGTVLARFIEEWWPVPQHGACRRHAPDYGSRRWGRQNRVARTNSTGHRGNNGGNNGAVTGWRLPAPDWPNCLKRQRPALVVAGRCRPPELKVVGSNPPGDEAQPLALLELLEAASSGQRSG